MNRTPDDIAKSLEDAGKSRDLPPLDKWHPELSGDMDLVITRDGQWVFKGEPIAREATVKLFSTILPRQAVRAERHEHGEGNQRISQGHCQRHLPITSERAQGSEEHF